MLDRTRQMGVVIIAAAMLVTPANGSAASLAVSDAEVQCGAFTDTRTQVPGAVSLSCMLAGVVASAASVFGPNSATLEASISGGQFESAYAHVGVSYAVDVVLASALPAGTPAFFELPMTVTMFSQTGPFGTGQIFVKKGVLTLAQGNAPPSFDKTEPFSFLFNANNPGVNVLGVLMSATCTSLAAGPCTTTTDPTFAFDQAAFVDIATNGGFDPFILEDFLDLEFSPNLVPIPAALPLLLSAIGGLVIVGWRKRSKL